MDALEEIARDSYDRIIGLELSEIAVDCCITKAPCGGEGAGKSPAYRGKRGLKRSLAVDLGGIPLGCLTAPANRHDSPLLPGTLKRVDALGLLLDGARGHLDRGYDSGSTRARLREFGLVRVISEKGKPSPLASTGRWVVERLNSWQNAHKKLAWCSERHERVIDFWENGEKLDLLIVYQDGADYDFSLCMLGFREDL